MNIPRRAAIFLSLLLFTVAFACTITALLTDFWLEGNYVGPTTSNRKHADVALALPQIGVIRANKRGRNSTSINAERKRIGQQSGKPLIKRIHGGLFRGMRYWSNTTRGERFIVPQELLHRPASRTPLRRSFSLKNRIPYFSSKAPWLFLVFFVSLSLLWTLIGVVISLLNTALDEGPRDVSGPMGLCLWSALAILSAVIAMAIFAEQYANYTTYKQPKHLHPQHTGLMSFNLGFSFWLLCLSAALQVGPILLICWLFPLPLSAVRRRAVREDESNGGKSGSTTTDS